MNSREYRPRERNPRAKLGYVQWLLLSPVPPGSDMSLNQRRMGFQDHTRLMPVDPSRQHHQEHAHRFGFHPPAIQRVRASHYSRMFGETDRSRQSFVVPLCPDSLTLEGARMLSALGIKDRKRRRSPTVMVITTLLRLSVVVRIFLAAEEKPSIRGAFLPGAERVCVES